MRVLAYTDGGVAAKNPSPLGGAWAYRALGDGVVIHQDSGKIDPAHCPGGVVTNNFAEMYAVIRALRWLSSFNPVTRINVRTDSEVTWRRVSRPDKAKMRGLPEWMVDELRKLTTHICPVYVSMVAGHPTKAELAVGYRATAAYLSDYIGGTFRVPVSEHNVWCDRECSRICASLLPERDWWVYSTVVQGKAILVKCRRSGALGSVNNPTDEEWRQAFNAPSKPYRWKENNRVLEAS